MVLNLCACRQRNVAVKLLSSSTMWKLKTVAQLTWVHMIVNKIHPMSFLLNWTELASSLNWHNVTTTNILRPFIWDYPSELVPEEAFTHSHLSWSSTIPINLPTMIHGIIPVQSVCLTVLLHKLFPSPLWSSSGSGLSTSFAIHFFTQSYLLFASLQRMYKWWWPVKTLWYMTGQDAVSMSRRPM